MEGNRSTDLLRQLAHSEAKSADLECKLAEAEAAHATDRALLRQALEALREQFTFTPGGPCQKSLFEREGRLCACEKCKIERAQDVLSSPEAKRVMEEEE